MSADSMHDLAAPYVLDALDPQERGRYEAHLESCEACRVEVARLSSGVEAIAAELATTPPASMKHGVMARIGAESEDVAPLRRRRWFGIPPLVAAAAAVAVLVIGVVGLLTFDRADDVDRVLLAEDVVTVALEDTPAYEGRAVTATLSYSQEEMAAVAAFTGLPPTPEDLAYQLWVIDESGPAPAGVFSPGQDETVVVLLDALVEAGDTIGVTIEPASGSETPTSEVLFAATV